MAAKTRTLSSTPRVRKTEKWPQRCQKKIPLLSRQKRHSGRLGWLGDTRRATCEPPSWGSDAERAGGHRVPPRSGAEGRVSACGGREGPGRCSVRLRQRSEMSRRWVIKHRRLVTESTHARLSEYGTFMSGEQWKLLCYKKSSRMTTFRAFVHPPPPQSNKPAY